MKMIAMTDVYELLVIGFHFRVSITHSGYEVDRLDIPDKTFPSSYEVRAIGYESETKPVFDENTIRADIKQWLQTVLSERA